MKKRKLKLSLPKQNTVNTDKMMERKDRILDDRLNETAGSKFMKKRSLLKRPNILGD